nr:MAG TPA: protein of Unknown Function (DUF1907) [Caudoviricetes sp.]
MNYVILIQDGKVTIDDIPNDIKKEVERWLNYFSTGVLKDGVNNEN